MRRTAASGTRSEQIDRLAQRLQATRGRSEGSEAHLVMYGRARALGRQGQDRRLAAGPPVSAACGRCTPHYPEAAACTDRGGEPGTPGCSAESTSIRGQDKDASAPHPSLFP